jgi:type I restriction enzyme S subunit
VKLPAYPRTKPSGVEWLGNVPEHWEVKPCRTIVRERTAKNDGGKCEDYLSLLANIGVIPYEEKGDIGNKKPTDLSKCKLVRRGDYVINSMNYRIGSYGISPYDGVCSSVYIVLTPRNEIVESRFAFRTFENREFQMLAQSFGNGILEHRCAINWDILKGIGVAIPPLPEQRAIAAFLDRETGRMDRLVAKKLELVERLKEKRIALISRTVTHGLPPAAARAAGLSANPSLKPSGLDWLGEVPAHWEATTVRRRAKRIQPGGTPPTAEERYYEDGTVPWFGPGSFDDQIVVCQPIKLLNASAVEEGVARMFAAGATMVVTIGATIGKVSSLTEIASCNQQITVIEFDQQRIHPRFATYQLKRLEPALRAIAPSATLPILDQGEIADIALGVPPLTEQVAIAAYLDEETAKLDALVGQVEAALERLREYRAALITAAVTGKIDVRNQNSIA